MIDWTRPIRTNKGAEARLLGELKNVAHPMVVAVTYTDSLGITYEVMRRYTRDGRFAEATHGNDHPLHLVNVPEVTKRYGVLADITTYEHLYQAKANRDTWMPGCRITEISYENGKPVKVDILDD